MITPTDIKSKLDEIEQSSVRTYNFISDISIKKDEDEGFKLSQKQFKKLTEIRGRHRPYRTSQRERERTLRGRRTSKNMYRRISSHTRATTKAQLAG